MGRKSSYRHTMGGRRTRRMRGGYEESGMAAPMTAPMTAPAASYLPREEEEEEKEGWLSKIGSMGSNMGSQLGSMGSRLKESTIGGRRRRRTLKGGRKSRKGGRKSRKGGRRGY